MNHEKHMMITTWNKITTTTNKQIYRQMISMGIKTENKNQKAKKQANPSHITVQQDRITAK